MKTKEGEKLYICDKKPGACDSWEKFGWAKCMSEYCDLTTNPDHASEYFKNKDIDLLIPLLCYREPIDLKKHKMIEEVNYESNIM